MNIFRPDLTLVSGSWFLVLSDAVFAILVLMLHFQRDRFHDFPIMKIVSLLLLGPLGLLLGMASFGIKLRYWELLMFTFTFGLFLFISISEWLLRGLAMRLTNWRGDKWVKELDYLYVTFGAFGVVISLNKPEVAADPVVMLSLWGPILLATAIVIRLIKTRAEIGTWNKL